MTLDELQEKLRAWADYNFPNALPYQPLLGVGEEVGELVEATVAADADAPASIASLFGLVAALGRLNHAHLKADQGIRGTPEQHRAAKMDSIGDILIYMADYCNKHHLSMRECLEMAWAAIKDRDWQRFPRNGRTE